MIRMIWKTINEPLFLNTVKKLRENEAKLPVEAKYRVAVISQAIYFEMLKAQAEAKKLLAIFAKKDEKGEIIGYPESDKIQFETKELEAEHDREFQKMLGNKFRIDSQPISVNDLNEIGLTGDELLSLKPILRDIVN